MCLLRFTDVVKLYVSDGQPVRALDGVSLQLSAGDFVALVGPSGCGKSTLLHLCGAMDRPTGGRLEIEGIPIADLREDRLTRLRRERVGFVFQFHYLLPEFDALENVMMPALIARVPKSKAREDAEAILVRVGLQHRLRHRVSTLSGGEQQRVAVARALVLKPEVLLADEPTGNLDPHSGSQVQELLLDLNREQGLTSVIVTHNLDLAQALTRQITLVDGKAMIV